MASEDKMTMQRAVAALRAVVADGGIALLADSSTGLVLCSDCAVPSSHDTLERIAEEARTALNSPYVTGVAGADTALAVTQIDDAGWTVAMRDAGGEEIVVCRAAARPDRAALDRAAAAVFALLRPAGGPDA